jgi:hypothetical protein
MVRRGSHCRFDDRRGADPGGRSISFGYKIDRTCCLIDVPYVPAQDEAVYPVPHLSRKVKEGRRRKIVLGATRVENMTIALRTRDLHLLEFRHL